MERLGLMRIVAALSRAAHSPTGDIAQVIEFLACLRPDGCLDETARIPAEYWRINWRQHGQVAWTGHLFYGDSAWFVRRDGAEDEPVLKLEATRLRPGDHLILRQPDGQVLGFRVVNVGPPAASC
jgi:hypothetical protein